jgi:hypothetical protein
MCAPILVVEFLGSEVRLVKQNSYSTVEKQRQDSSNFVVTNVAAKFSALRIL